MIPNQRALGQRFLNAGTRPEAFLLGLEIFLKFTNFNMNMTKIIEFIQ